MNKYTDGQLYLNYFYDNDVEAFRIIFEKYKDSLILFLNNIVKNYDDAEELMIDTFAVLSSKTAHYKERENVSFKTWLYSIAKNKARMYIRKNKSLFFGKDNEIAFENIDNITDKPDDNLLDQTIINDERNALIFKALNHLEDDYRQVLYLLYFEDMTPNDICKVMKKSTKQIYNLTSRGKKSLKTALERMGYSWDIF